MKSKAINRRFSKLAIGVLASALVFTSFMAPGPLSANAGVLDAAQDMYESDYDSYMETMEASSELNIEIAGEGFVLMKNQNDALPLAAGERNVTVLSAFMEYGGGGSGAQGVPTNSTIAAQHDWIGLSEKTVYEGLEYDEADGFSINAAAEELVGTKGIGIDERGNAADYKYMDLNDTTGTTEFQGHKYNYAADNFFAAVESSFEDYSTAIVTISRTGSEFVDNQSHDVEGHTDSTDHYLTLTDAEEALLAYVKYQKAQGNFDKVVILLQTPAVMEIANIVSDEDFDAILWLGTPGWNGNLALGGVLSGRINPSGRLVDFWMNDFYTDPTMYNVLGYTGGNYAINGEQVTPGLNGSEGGGGSSGDGSSTIHMLMDPSVPGYTENESYHLAIDYAEGIYMGYRYYETVYEELAAATDEDTADAWYDATVAFPFGYGLSYTTFEFSNMRVSASSLTEANMENDITVTVDVENTGDVAGKTVVQLYSSPEYFEGEIEKAAVNLVGYTKTPIIEPGDTETVEVVINAKDLAEFDYNDANDNGHFGYEIDAGDVVLKIMNNSHDVLLSSTLSAAADINYEQDDDPNTPNNIYSQTGNAWELYNTLSSNWLLNEEDHYLSRTQLIDGDEVALEMDWEVGDPNDLQLQLGYMLDGDDNRTFQEKAMRAIDNQHISDNSGAQANAGTAKFDYDNRLTAEVETDYENLWVKTEEDVAGWTQGTGVKGEDGMYAITLQDMKGVPLGDAKWDEFMDQFTWDELTALVTSGSFSTAAVGSVDKPATEDNDGPNQLKNGDLADGTQVAGWGWVGAPVIASTWNAELAYEQGRAVGNESLWMNVNGWYGPAMNTHRNPLAGRNFEYYSQDGVQGGIIASNVVKGATEMGMHPYIKHIFLNDQETSRMGTMTFATEQAIRQIYAKVFELCITDGNGNGTMSAFNHIGLASSVSYATNIQLYENEWGMDGVSVTDMYSEDTPAWNGDNIVRGHTIPLGRSTAFTKGEWKDNMVYVEGEASPTQWFWTRDTAQRIFYVIGNGNEMDNGLPQQLPTFVDGEADVIVDVNRADSEQLITVAELETYFGDAVGDAGITVSNVTGLPEGMTWAVNNGAVTVSGTATAPGDYTVAVRVRGNGGFGYIERAVEFELLARVAGETGSRVSFFGGTVAHPETVDPNVEPSADTVGQFASISYEIVGSSHGLTIDAEGMVSGFLPQGETTVTIRQYGQQVVGSGGWRPTYSLREVEYTKTVTLFGEGEGGGEVDFYFTIDSNGHLILNYSDGRTEDLGKVVGDNGATGPAGPQGPAGEQGPAGPAGQDGTVIEGFEINSNGELVVTYGDGTTENLGKVVGEKGDKGDKGDPGDPAEGGCGGSIATVSVVGAVALIALAGTAVVLFKKKDA